MDDGVGGGVGGSGGGSGVMKCVCARVFWVRI